MPERPLLPGLGQILDGEARAFRLFLPPFPLILVWHRDIQTITLPWLSPIPANTQKNRSVNLWFTTYQFSPNYDIGVFHAVTQKEKSVG
uniref:Uncharacterized protein n=1 Tax=Candidatus Kentrum sp. DK TaxID=2126562 RepID=A0A450TGD8_9GAMM|nr:MAG: hypothetical protein BECKDK2373C_GA0170839_11442 [Candidatus Kentron sp. DK]